MAAGGSWREAEARHGEELPPSRGSGGAGVGIGGGRGGGQGEPQRSSVSAIQGQTPRSGGSRQSQQQRLVGVGVYLDNATFEVKQMVEVSHGVGDK